MPVMTRGKGKDGSSQFVIPARFKQGSIRQSQDGFPVKDVGNDREGGKAIHAKPVTRVLTYFHPAAVAQLYSW